MGRRGYPPEFRRKVLDLVEAGRPVPVLQLLNEITQLGYTGSQNLRIATSPKAVANLTGRR